ncbi:HoxV [Pseudomonas panipatensis]|uniref:Nickel-dependent hydrogenase n=1 Tax=Pseudomonas panipatensis TaxID=428992 RepID=A0A1G8LJR5_9PSED|nr:HoxV [Pseudomonas panipatensis]SDI55916.1 hypothetical protein SAMN05216272_111192 [Pseudomonas panipatensis]SMP74657.1 hypothetical protein SAMN06295951_1138 [Pseudomonas panipatensis]
MTGDAGLARLAGSLRVRPGQRPALLGGRPPLAARLLQGQPAEAAAQRLPLLYSLCGQAHRLTAELALQAAREGTAEASDAARQALHAETRREHLRRIVLDWPGLLGGATADPLALSAVAQQGLDAWFEGSAQAWLDAWREGPRQALLDWSARGRHWLARLLRDCRDEAEALLLPVHALPVAPARLLAVEQNLRQGDAFIRQPELDGQPCETGAWTRAWEAHPQRHGNAWLRLGARLADLAELSLEAPRPLALGALAVGECQALAWCETARGLLLHRVHLETGANGMQVCDYQVLAPTEWNLHPRGALAQALEALPASGASGRRQAELLLAAFDPCLAYRLEMDAGHSPEQMTSDRGAPQHA